MTTAEDRLKELQVDEKACELQIENIVRETTRLREQIICLRKKEIDVDEALMKVRDEIIDVLEEIKQARPEQQKSMKEYQGEETQ